jgi:hypothetical protein
MTTEVGMSPLTQRFPAQFNGIRMCDHIYDIYDLGRVFIFTEYLRPDVPAAEVHLLLF